MTTETFSFEVDHSWEHTLFAYDRKSWTVPNRQFPEILKCTFNDWRLDENTNTVSFTRVAHLKPPLPTWLMRVLSGVKETELQFETTIDRQNRTAVVIGKNNTLTNILEMTEHLEMKEHPENASRTMVTFTATWKIKLKLFSSKFENYLMSNYSKALERGREIDHQFLMKFKEEERELPPLSYSERNCASLPTSKCLCFHFYFYFRFFSSKRYYCVFYFNEQLLFFFLSFAKRFYGV
eukprot:m.41582 g.41582  ORF g.41582 m.41582 type:complete len:237 (+) comp10438_c0_seq4:37-747(+)